LLNKSLLAALAAVLSMPAFAEEAPIEIGNGQKEFPESITSTSDGALYAGSLTHGTVMKVAPGATASEPFIAAPDSGPASSFGVHADEANGTLWVCYGDMAGFAGAEAMPSVLVGYDLATGSKKTSATFSGASLCNDIATDPDGVAFAADTIGGRIVRVAPGSDIAQNWASDPLLAGADGLAFGGDGSLYVNSVTTNRLFRIAVEADGSAGAITELAISEPLAGPDGMRSGPNGKLYLAENGNGRISEITVEGDTATLRALPVPEMLAPTAVTLVGNRLHILEAKIGLLSSDADPGTFKVHAILLE
jgi:sugar lactone lactonase YvrE